MRGGFDRPRSVGGNDEADKGHQGRDEGPDFERQTLFAFGGGGDGLFDEEDDHQGHTQSKTDLCGHR